MKILSLFIALGTAVAYGQVHQWSKSFVGSNGNGVYSITTDQADNVYGTGIFFSSTDLDTASSAGAMTSAGGSDLFVAKYAPNGVYQWSFKIGTGSAEQTKSIAVDDQGNIYIAGGFQTTTDFDPGPNVFNLTSSPAGSRGFIAKYDPNGNFIWAKGLSAISEGRLYIVVTPQQEIYCTGTFGGIGDFDPGPGIYNLNGSNGNTFLGKYDSNGDMVWVKQLGSNNGLEGNSLARDSAGDLVVFGNFIGTSDFDPSSNSALLTSSGSYENFIAKYDSNGNYLWAKRIGGTQGEFSRCCRIDNNDNILITGAFTGTADFDPEPAQALLTSNGTIDAYVAKYDPLGNYIWSISMGSFADDVAYALAIDSANNAYVTGSFQHDVDFDPGAGTALIENGSSNNTFLAKYDSNGQYLWAYDINCNNTSAGYALHIDQNDNVLMGGFYMSTVDFDFGVGTANALSSGGFLAKYSAGLLSTESVLDSVAAVVPNPSNGQFELRAPITGPYQIKVYNTIGQCVWQQKAQDFSGMIALNQPDGLYYLCVETTDKKSTHKIVIRN